MWHLYPNETPPDIPKDEDFGVEYEVRYRLPNGKVKTMITEWLWERQWNCIYLVISENVLYSFLMLLLLCFHIQILKQRFHHTQQ